MLSAEDRIYNLLEALRATSSRTEKTKLVKELATLPEDLYVLQQTYNPFITYGIKPPKCAYVPSKKALLSRHKLLVFCLIASPIEH